MEAGLGPIEQDLAMHPHPDFACWLNGDQGATQGLEAFIKPLDRAVIDSFKDIKIARADQMTAANPALHFFLGFGWEHSAGRLYWVADCGLVVMV
jgi:hypothetical protein